MTSIAYEAAARNFMEEDPAVTGGLMTAELHPLSIALARKSVTGASLSSY